MLPSNVDEPDAGHPVEAPDEEAAPEARMRAVPGEPALSKVPSITQGMLRDEDEHVHRWRDDGTCSECDERRPDD